MIAEQWLLVLGCAVYGVLGLMHGYFTLASNRLDPREPQLIADMQRVHPVLTRQTTMWKAWVGFNLSHSLGAILFAVMFIVLTVENYVYLKSSVALTTLLVAVCLIYIWLGFKYWFSKPRNGILIGSALVALSLGLRWLH